MNINTFIRNFIPSNFNRVEKGLFFGASLLWLLSLSISFIWNWWSIGNFVTENAIKEAESSYNKDLAYRYWGACMGGVYVDASKATPNPYLANLKERDVLTDKGQKLTLINPAYMTRMVYEITKERYGLLAHITSLNPIRPANTPDQWERQALKAFEKGVKEVHSIEEFGGEPMLRYMRPFVTEKPCLKCHAAQGYELGDIRGGISISVPFTPYLVIMKKLRMQMGLAHGAIGMVGLCLLAGGMTLISRNRRALSENEKRHRTLMDAIPDIICFKDGKGRWLEANKFDLELFELTDVDYRGKTDAELAEYSQFYRDAFLECEKSDEEAWEKGELSRGIEIIPLSKGGHKIFDVIKVPIFQSSGERQGLLVVGRDITEQYMAQEEKARLEQQLRQSQKLESIGRLAGGVAHDINNMLVPVLGYSELMSTLAQDDTIKKYAAFINEAGKKAQDIVRQLLAFSRKQVIEKKPVNINTIIVNFQKFIKRTLRENIEIELHLATNLPTVEVDAGQFEQIVLNLAVNAQHAMPDGGRFTIETSAVYLDEEYTATHHGVKQGNYVMISFSDTGCGIPKEVMEHIFEPFFTTREDGTGTGLGLATVYGIVKQHGGHIYLYSEPDKGTTFKIYLPASGVEAKDTKQIDRQIHSEHFNAVILLTEDEESVRTLAATVLKQYGFQVIEASTPAEALEKIQNFRGKVDLLLTDVIMPGMNGQELHHKLRERYNNLKVLFMSGYTDNIISHHGILKDDINFISKPFTIDDLINKIRMVLDG